MFNVACRVTEPPERLLSSYRLGDIETRQTEEGLLLISAAGSALLSLETDTASFDDAPRIEDAPPSITIQCGLSAAGDSPATHRWVLSLHVAVGVAS